MKLLIGKFQLSEEFWVGKSTSFVFFWNIESQNLIKKINLSGSHLEFETQFLSKLMTWLLTPRSHSKVFQFSLKLKIQSIDFFLRHWNLSGWEIPEMLVTLTDPDFETHVSPEQLSDFNFLGCEFTEFNLSWSNASKTIVFFGMNFFLMPRNAKKGYYFWHALIFNLLLPELQIYLFHFSNVVWINRFLLEADFIFLLTTRVVLASQLESWVASSGKYALCIDFSWYSNSFSAKTTALNSFIKV